MTIKTVKDIYNHLEKFVIGQEEAKRVISYAGYMHQLRYQKRLDSTAERELLAYYSKKLLDSEAQLPSLREKEKELRAAMMASTGDNFEVDSEVAKSLASSDENMQHLLRKLLKEQTEKRLQLVSSIANLKKQKKDLENRPKYLNTKKSNALIIGPSGCGKTYMIQKMAEYLDFPVLIINATQITATGWSGQDLDDYMAMLYESEHPKKDGTIVFIDEFDKICEVARTSGGQDFNKQTQYCFLNLIEGTTYNLTSKGNQQAAFVDTENLLFLFGGNFQYMRDMEKKKREKQGIGFNPDESHKVEIDNKAISAKLQEYNVAREVAGRISLMAEVKKLTREQLRDILLKAEGNIYAEYNYYTGIELTETDVEEILDTCIRNNTGARGLQAAIDRIVLNKLFLEDK